MFSRPRAGLFATPCKVVRLYYAFVEAATLRSIVLRYTGAPIAICVSFFLDMSLFSSIFCTISAFSLYKEVVYVVRSFLPNGVFLPCDHGLDFFTSAINQSSFSGLATNTLNVRNNVLYYCVVCVFSFQ